MNEKDKAIEMRLKTLENAMGIKAEPKYIEKDNDTTMIQKFLDSELFKTYGGSWSIDDISGGYGNNALCYTGFISGPVNNNGKDSTEKPNFDMFIIQLCYIGELSHIAFPWQVEISLVNRHFPLSFGVGSESDNIHCGSFSEQDFYGLLYKCFEKSNIPPNFALINQLRYDEMKKDWID